MTEDDLRAIERSLSIELPSAYRAAMLSFPVPAFALSSDTELWDDASAVVTFNQELRNGQSGDPWPAHMFALGHAGDGSPSAIDLNSPDAAVWWVDRCGLSNDESYESHASFDVWLTEYVEHTRHDAEANCIDPDGTPAEREAVEAEFAGTGCWDLLKIIGAVIVAAILYVVVRVWTGW